MHTPERLYTSSTRESPMMLNERVGGALRAASVALAVLLSAMCPLPAQDRTPPPKPNVIILLTDDLGYGDLGCYGSKTIRTPNLDRLAQGGIRLMDFYSANSVCSPARAGLLTGRYPTRTTVANVILPEIPGGMPPSEVTMAELLQPAGYATACIGKWHLGHAPEFLPTRQGFDTYFGIPYSNDMSIDPQAPLAENIQLNRGVTVEGIRADRYNRRITNAGGDASSPAERFYVPLMRGEEVVEFPVDQATLTQRYTDEAIAFIRANRDRPFFLYLPYAAPHVPLAVTEAFRGRSQAGLYGDAVEELDWNIGRMMAVLAELGLEEKTLVVFTSDNGPWLGLGESSGTAGPLKGGKFRTEEGGQRVPMIARWTGQIPAGQVGHAVVSALDLFPTVAALAGQPLPGDREIDGRDLWPLLRGGGDAALEEADFFYVRGWEVQAVRRGPWKVQEAVGGHAYRGQKIPGNPGHLYHLGNDAGETTNVADQHPGTFERLKKRIAEMEPRIGSGAEKAADDPRGKPPASTPGELRCEYQARPMSLDIPVPRFAWRWPDGATFTQRAYRMQVADGKGSVHWDSGKVESGESVLVPYAGPPLESDSAYTWRVKVWGEDGAESEWSAPAHFETAKLSRDDFHAFWIQPVEKAVEWPLPVELLRQVRTGKSVWVDLDWLSRKGVPGIERVRFRKDLTLEAAPRKAVLVSNGGRTGAVWINGNKITGVETGVEVTAHLRDGVNHLAFEVVGRKDRPGEAFFALRVENPDGSLLTLNADDTWQAKRVEEGDPDTAWTTLPTQETDGWRAPRVQRWAEAPGRGAIPLLDDKKKPRSLLWRREFTLEKPVQSARLLISSLGWSEFRLNGNKVGDAALFPAWTDYHDRVEYAVHDVTPLLRSGPNALGAMTGNGWYSGGLMYGFHWGRTPSVFAELRVTHSDGTETVVISDNQWRWSPSPVLRNHIYFGEEYDARLEQDGWDLPGFEDAAWKPVVENPFYPLERMVGEQVAPIRVTEELRPVSITPSPGKPGAWIVDFGQNFAGRCRITVRGAEAGARIGILHAEVLDNEGGLDVRNLREAAVPDLYIAKGAAEETWEPRFTYHGFRYAEVSGLPAKPRIGDVTGRVLHSDIERTGRLRTSNDLLNRFVANIDWGLRSNFMSVPTDCPQRPERLGWTGDAQAFAPSAMYLRDSARFFSKWTGDLVDTRGAPNQAPLPQDGQFQAPGWADALTVVPWNLYLYYGDTRPMASAYPAMQRFIEHMREESEKMGTPWLYWQGGWGDWLNTEKTDSKQYGAYYFYRSTDLLSRMADVLGKKEDAGKYRGYLEKIRAAILAKQLTGPGQFGDGKQSTLAVPLAFDIIPEDQKPALARALAASVAEDGFFPKTGFLGTPVLLPVLSGSGHQDVAGKLALQEGDPSWLNMVKSGFTTVTERWSNQGVNSDMQSYNHFLFGCVAEWYFGYLAGIRPEPARPGFKHFVVQPHPIEGLDHVEAEFDSLYGTIRSRWQREGGAIRFQITVPPNTTATVLLPGKPVSAPLPGVPEPDGTFWRFELKPGVFECVTPLQ